VDQEAVGGLVVGGVDCDIDWKFRVDVAALEVQVSCEASLHMPIDETININRLFSPEEKILIDRKCITRIPDTLVVSLKGLCPLIMVEVNPDILIGRA
jgi:hypothetical protein